MSYDIVYSNGQKTERDTAESLPQARVRIRNRFKRDPSGVALIFKGEQFIEVTSPDLERGADAERSVKGAQKCPS